MRNEEYEKRRQALEEQYQEDLELLRAGYHARLRALEALWLAPHGGGEADSQRPAQRAVHSGTPAGPETRKSGKKARPHPRGGLPDLIRKVLPQLPEEFEKRDLVQALGFEPRRTTLVRTLQEMVLDKEIAYAEFSGRRQATTYRKVTRPT